MGHRCRLAPLLSILKRLISQPDMVSDYAYWQFVAAPQWLGGMLYTIHRALLQFFSVPFMVRTLFSHWHRDIVPYRGGLSDIFLAIAWNLISRTIGFLIRATVLALWLIVELVALPLTVALYLAFLAWPLLIIAAFVSGVFLFTN